MADRITYKRLKNWLYQDSLFTQGFKLSAYSGYYHIEDDIGNNIISESTPRKCWESWYIFKKGYYFAKGVK